VAGVLGMTKMQGRSASQSRVDRRATLLASFLVCASFATVLVPSAHAAPGYEPDASIPSRALVGVPRGIAIDPVSQDIFVAILSANLSTGSPGEIDRFNSDLTADGTIAKGTGYYAGVAVNPVTPYGIYGAQMKVVTTFGTFGTSKLDVFSALGEPTGSSVLPYTASLPDIATDSEGNVFYPNVSTHSVQVFDPSGTLLEEITCVGCPGGTFGQPGSVALSSTDALYVADVDPDRVVKLTPSGGSYSFATVVQSGRAAGAVAVDSLTGDVLVGDMPGGRDYHIVAYNSSGTQIDDFAAGVFPDSTGEYGALAAYLMEINPTTHKLYVVGTNKLHIFERTTIDPPATTIKSATGIGQLTATLNATVNANGHATLECEFEYTDEADFLANGFTNAADVPCPQMPAGSGAIPLGIKVSVLAPATGYRYRVTATSNAGSTTSGNQAFETLPVVPPSVTTESPLSVTQTTATIRGRTNPHGGSVSNCHFDFGTSLSYGSVIPCPTSLGPATTDVAQNGGVSGLLQSTTYHYRLVVTTNAGTAAGADVEFTTANPPLEPEPEPTPTTPPTTTPAPSGPVITPPPPRCGKGFRRQMVRGKPRCVKVCRQGFRRKLVRGKVKCVKSSRSAGHRHRRV
jgi:hypothetical protein